ncbi:MAG: 4-hydroxy-tetrahydrodipicolinate reductase [Candidatus Micrarchaeia archaeon]
MIKIVSCGLGKTGLRVAQLAQEDNEIKVIAGVRQKPDKEKTSFPVFSPKKLNTAIQGADVFVDFSNTKASMQNLPIAAKAGLNLVIGTTGFTTSQIEQIEKTVKKHKVSAVMAPNFSVGVNLFFKFAKNLAKALKDYDAEIIEAHHNEKKDAPSGTAIRVAKIIGNAMNIKEENILCGREGLTGARGNEIRIHSIRAGDIVGEHEVLFAANHEQIKLSHTAQSRDCFAKGAVRAIKWVANKKDGKIHSMNDVLEI